jgi:hypothetical protein
MAKMAAAKVEQVSSLSPEKGKKETSRMPVPRASTLLDTRVIYCGDDLDQLKKLPDACVDLIYIDPPFNSNRNCEIFWPETSEKRRFDDRHESTKASGNNRIQQFSAADGSFIASFGTQGSNVGQFNAPEGLAYDSSGTLYIVDSGNNRIVIAEGFNVMDVTGTSGTDLGQFNAPGNISVGERGVYVADTGNNRIQSFSPAPPDSLFSIGSSTIRFAISANLNQPAAVAAVDSLTNEMFYVADTGNNRVILCNVPADSSDVILAVWNSMTNHVTAGDIPGALSYFSVAAVDNYQQAFFSVGTANTISAINQIGALTPVFIMDNTAEYYFTNTIDGQIITFPVEFDKENGVWKIFEF